MPGSSYAAPAIWHMVDSIVASSVQARFGMAPRHTFDWDNATQCGLVCSYVLSMASYRQSSADLSLDVCCHSDLSCMCCLRAISRSPSNMPGDHCVHALQAGTQARVLLSSQLKGRVCEFVN